MAHSHDHRHHEHDHGHRHEREASHGARNKGSALHWAAILTLVFALVEAAGGWWSGSLALLSDAGHMFTDGAALALGALAARMARRPPSGAHSYGFGRIEIFAAVVNAAAMIVIALAVSWEAIVRLGHPAPVDGAIAAAIAAAGLVLNVVVLRWLSPHGHDLNVRGARLHVFGDLLGSIAALASGLAIALTGWLAADAVASLLISALLVVSSARLLREGLHVLMEAAPPHVPPDAVVAEMAAVEGVRSVHDLHIWTLSGSRTALSAHVVVGQMTQWPHVLRALQGRMHEKFGIDHVTLQPETAERPLVHVKKR